LNGEELEEQLCQTVSKLLHFYSSQQEQTDVLKSWTGPGTWKGPKCLTGCVHTTGSSSWETSFSMPARLFVDVFFSPLHRLGSISVKVCCAMCSYTGSVNKQRRKERGTHLTVMLMSGPAPLCCFLLLFLSCESCSCCTSGNPPPRVLENIQNVNSYWANGPVVTFRFSFSVFFATFSYTACTCH